MKVCFLSSAHPALDKRVFDKEARSLHQHGFEVLHLCPQSEGEPLGGWQQDGIHIETYPRLPGIRGRFRQLIRLYRRAKAVGADVYHCNEVDSWAIGVLLRIFTGRKCVFDVHEHYPSTFAESRFPRWLQPMIAGSVRLFYALLTTFTYRIVLAKRSVAPDFWFARRKLVLVQNFTPLAALTSQGNGERQPHTGPATLIHLGLIGEARGWPQLLDALAQMRHQDCIIHIIGKFHDGTEEAFFTKARALSLHERIKFDRWMPFDQAFKLLTQADVGLILFQPGIQNHVFALPHKMFDYMLAELPLVAPAFAAEVREIVDESGCGLLVDPADPHAIAAALDKLLAEPDTRAELGQRGRDAVLKKYNWEAEAQQLIEMYSKCAAEK